MLWHYCISHANKAHLNLNLKERERDLISGLWQGAQLKAVVFDNLAQKFYLFFLCHELSEPRTSARLWTSALADWKPQTALTGDLSVCVCVCVCVSRLFCAQIMTKQLEFTKSESWESWTWTTWILIWKLINTKLNFELENYR